MARRVFLFIAIIVFCLSISANAVNLLSNPGFESFPSGTSYGDGSYTQYNWRFFSVAGAAGSLQTVTPGHTGNIAIKLTRGSTSGDSGLDRDGSPMVPAVAGHRYRATVWAKSDAGSKLNLSVAAHDSSKNWLGVQKTQLFTLKTSYAKCVFEFVSPANTAFLNFALRVEGTGNVTLDDCELADLSADPPSVPTITYPVSETADSTRPTIAFSGSPHTTYQAMITNASGTVWDSGTVNSGVYSFTCPVSLSTGTNYSVKVRLQNEVGWGDWSQTSQFTVTPTIRIISPAEADAVRGPDVTVRWHTDPLFTGQSISIDGKPGIALAAGVESYAFSGVGEGLHTVTIHGLASSTDVTSTARFYARITPADSDVIYYYDMSYVLNYNRRDDLHQRNLQYDIPHAVAALQGLVNRKGARLFVKLFPEDEIWWNRMRESGNWLANKTVVTIPTGAENLPLLFNTFKGDYKGAVVWDPSVYSTSNVASTVAGADNLIPVQYDPSADSVYDLLVANGPKLPVKINLVGKFTGSGIIPDTNLPSTGSRKNDAYVWARTLYLESGKCNPSLLMYGIDAYWLAFSFRGQYLGHTLPSRDYIIQNKGFVFDLDVWGDERPMDDQYQPLGTDLATLKSILYSAATRSQGMVCLMGFIPWMDKYTDYTYGHTHDTGDTEWESIKLFSAYNAYSDGDAYAYVDVANASIYSRFPLPDRLTQNRRLSLTDLRKLGYIDTNNNIAPLNFLNIYMGDYDSGAWLVRPGNDAWSDTWRGSIPLSWAFNPNLVSRMAAVYEYYNRTRTDNDSFIAGDSGAGYINPSYLLGTRDSGLASAKDIWIAHNLDYFRKTNTKITGFIINGKAGVIGSDVESMYQQFSPDGVFSQPLWYPQGDHLSGTMPALLQQRDLTLTVGTDTDIIQPQGNKETTQFLNYRTVLTTPAYVWWLLYNITGRDAAIPWALVDAPTYAALASSYMSKTPDYRATYTFDTIPGVMAPGATANISVGVRNDGWITWKSSGFQSAYLRFKWKRGTQLVSAYAIKVPVDISSGGSIVLDGAIPAPSTPGAYTLTYEMAIGSTYFSSQGDYCWQKTIIVTPSLGGSPADVKAYPDSTNVTIWNAVVTAGTDQLDDKFYVEDEKRTSGIKVLASSLDKLYEGDRVSLTGQIWTDGGERYMILGNLLTQTPGEPLAPVAMQNGTVGGSRLNSLTPGVTNCTGTHNTGLLVTVYGRVIDVDPSLTSFFIDDGSGVISKDNKKGLRISFDYLADTNSITPPDKGDYVRITGISTVIDDGITPPTTYPIIQLRKQADVQIIVDN